LLADPRINSAGQLIIPVMMLCGAPIQWTDTIKYLGISFIAGKTLLCDIDGIVRKFYTASNSILGCTGNLNELLKLHLQQVYVLPVLQYCMSAIRLTRKQENTLNVCWNNVYRKIFKFNKRESVSIFICGLGILTIITCTSC